MGKSKDGPIAKPAWWWLPGQTQGRVPGLYRLNEDNRPFVETYAAVVPGVDWIGSGRNMAILHGDALGTKITALDLRPTNERRNFGSDLAHSKFSPQYVIEDAHLGLDDLVTAAVDVSFLDQEVWWNRQSVRVAEIYESGYFARRLEHSKISPEVAQLPGGTLAARDATIFHDPTPGIPYWIAGSEFEIRLTAPIPFKEVFTGWIGSLERLLTFSGHELARTAYVKIQCESETFGEGLEFRTLHTRWSGVGGQSRDRSRSLIDYLFLSTDIDWPAVATLVEACARLGSRDGRPCRSAK